MKETVARSFITLILFAAPAFPSASAQTPIAVEPAFPSVSFNRPVDLRNAGDGSDRLFVVEQKTALIKVIDNDSSVVEASTFLDLSARVATGGNEEGLLGLAFHPSFATNRFFYTYYSAYDPRRIVVSRFAVDAADSTRADPSSELVLLEVSQPFSNHNGGSMAFGPNGYLHIGLGDGGDQSDPLGHGQNRGTLLGAVLRIDVDNPAEGRNYGIPPDNPFAGNTSGFREEIWAYGFRNPWRMSIDDVGRLWVGDVGQGAIEEVDIVEPGGNYGWNIMEGSICHTPRQGCSQVGLELPVAEYDHGEGRSITGGYVYTGPIADLVGTYIYGDYVSGRVWSLDLSGPSPVARRLLDTGLSIASFGMDEAGELYICAFDGRIYRFIPEPSIGTERNETDPRYGRVSVFPNPFQSALNIDISSPTSTELRIDVFDILGRLRHSARGRLHRGSNRVRVEDLDVPPGTYWIRVRIGNSDRWIGATHVR